MVAVGSTSAEVGVLSATLGFDADATGENEAAGLWS
jgi:hypothetical protein